MKCAQKLQKKPLTRYTKSELVEEVLLTLTKLNIYRATSTQLLTTILTYPDDHTIRSTDTPPGFKPFTVNVARVLIYDHRYPQLLTSEMV